MMSISQKYEEFPDPDDFSKSNSVVETRDVDNEKLVSFEEGYQAGWDDATNAQRVSEANLCDALVENLQEISFGFHEAKRELIREIQPLFDQIFDTFLPELIKVSIGPYIVEKIMALTREASDQLLLVEVSVDDYPSLRTFFDAQNLSSFELREQSNLTASQVVLKIGEKEIEINFDQALRDIRTSINDLIEKE
jgi:flagellar assembly protein FliH